MKRLLLLLAFFAASMPAGANIDMVLYRTLRVSGDVKVVMTREIEKPEYGGNVKFEDVHGSYQIESGQGTGATVRIPFDRWERISLSGGARLEWEGTLEVDTCKIVCLDKSTIKGRVEAARLDIGVGSKAELYLTGSAETLDLLAEEGARGDCSELETVTANCYAYTKSKAGVRASGTLTIEADQTSDVTFSGNPEQMNVCVQNPDCQVCKPSTRRIRRK